MHEYLVRARSLRLTTCVCTMEFFIEKVRLYPCLWDMNDMSYRNIVKKDLAWERIAKECGMANAQEAKSQWKKLRDSHREALRRRRIKTSTGQPAHNLKPWRYETVMAFILPQAENSASFSNFSNDSQDSIYDTRYISDTTANNTVTESPPSESPRSTSESPLPPLESPFSLSESPLSRYFSSPSPEPGNRSQKRRATESVSEILQEREKNREQRQWQREELRRKVIDLNRVPQDALSNLFASFCQKTRELPKHLQLRVQREIFESVTRAEEEALSLDSKNTYYNIPSTSTYANSSLPCVSTQMQPQPTYSSSPLSNVVKRTQPQETYVAGVNPDAEQEIHHLPNISTVTQTMKTRR